MIRCFHLIVSNWRLKLKLIGVGFLLLVILNQHLNIKLLRSQQVTTKVEMRTAREAIHSVIDKLKAAVNHSANNLDREILALDNAALLLGQPPGDGGHVEDRGLVCPEQYEANTDWPYYMRDWTVENCGYGRKVGDLVTLVFSVDKEEQVYNNFYHDIMINRVN